MKDLIESRDIKLAAQKMGLGNVISSPGVNQTDVKVAFVSDKTARWDTVKQGSPAEINSVGQFGVLPVEGFAVVSQAGVAAALPGGTARSKVIATLTAFVSKYYTAATINDPSRIELLNWQVLPSPSYSLLKIEGLVPPRKAAATVTTVSSGSAAPFPVENLDKMGSLGAKIKADVKQLESAATGFSNDYRKELSLETPPEMFWTSQDVESLRFALAHFSKHIASVQVDQEGDTVASVLQYQTTSGAVNLGGGYGSPAGFTVNGSANINNLFLPFDSMTLAASGGPDSYNLSLGYQGNLWESQDYAWSLQIAPSVQFTQQSKILLGNPGGPYLREDVFKAGAAATLAYDSSRLQANIGSASRDCFSATIDPYFRKVHLNGPAVLIGDDGQGSSPCIDFLTTWSRSRPSGNGGRWDTSASAEFNIVPDFGGQGTTYVKSSLQGNCTLYFGPATGRTDYFTRMIAGLAYVSNGSPRFDDPELGGDQIVRGLREGVVIGRGAVYETLEGGVRATTLLKLFMKQLPVALNNEPFQSIYLKILGDHGDAWARPVSPGYSRISGDVSSVGAGFEYDGTSGGHPIVFTLGYAWSPEANDTGRVFTAVSVQF